jgi:hypothetical protein
LACSTERGVTPIPLRRAIGMTISSMTAFGLAPAASKPAAAAAPPGRRRP